MSAPSSTPIGLAPGAPEQAAGQDAKKYGSTNPVVKKLLDRWTTQLRATIGAVPDDAVVVDVGVGEGLSLERFLPEGIVRSAPSTATTRRSSPWTDFPGCRRSCPTPACCRWRPARPTW